MRLRYGFRGSGLAVPVDDLEEVWRERRTKTLFTVAGRTHVGLPIRRLVRLASGETAEARRNDAATVLEVERSEGQDATVRPVSAVLRASATDFKE